LFYFKELLCLYYSNEKITQFVSNTPKIFA